MMFYACVEKYINGEAAFAYVSEDCPSEDKFLGGAYDTREEAESAAMTLRKLLKAGKTARDNDEYWKEHARKYSSEPWFTERE